MKPRGEPRFKTETDVTIQLLRKEAHQLGRIVDVSGAGFGLLLKDAVTVGEPLRMIVGDYHVLAMVRYCVPSEGAYSAGVERVDEWLPVATDAPLEKAPGQDDTPAIGRAQLKGHLGFLRTHALRDLFSRQSAPESSRRLVLGGIAAATTLGLVVLVLRHPW
jgi:PilZ domain